MFRGIDLTKPDRDRQLDRKVKTLRESRHYEAPLSEPHCGEWTPPGLVVVRLRYPNDDVSRVKLHAKAMCLYLRVLKDAAYCEVTTDFASPYSGTYRSFTQQNRLYLSYKAGTGHKAANPCSGYHRCGRAIDLRNGIMPLVEEAMTGRQEDGLRFYHGDVFGDPPHYSFGELG